MVQYVSHFLAFAGSEVIPLFRYMALGTCRVPDTSDSLARLLLHCVVVVSSSLTQHHLHLLACLVVLYGGARMMMAHEDKTTGETLREPLHRVMVSAGLNFLTISLVILFCRDVRL